MNKYKTEMTDCFDWNTKYGLRIIKIVSQKQEFNVYIHLRVLHPHLVRGRGGFYRVKLMSLTAKKN